MIHKKVGSVMFEKLAKIETERMFYENDQKEHRDGMQRSLVASLKRKAAEAEETAYRRLEAELKNDVVKYAIQESAYYIIKEMKPVFRQWTNEFYVHIERAQGLFDLNDLLRMSVGTYQFTSRPIRFMTSIAHESMEDFKL